MGELSPGVLPASSHILPTSKIVHNVTKSVHNPVLAVVISLVLYGCHTSGQDGDVILISTVLT